jgi:hypothetical protein
MVKIGLILYAGEIVRDMWESEDPKAVLRGLTLAVLAGKGTWADDFGEGATVRAYAVAGEASYVPVTIATPKGCRKPRPCVEGVDLLEWFTAKQAEPTPVEAEPAAWLSPAEVAHAEVPADEQIAADADAAAHVSLPLERLRHHVTGAIERGETTAIVEKMPAPVFDFSTKKGVRAYWAAQRGART